MFFLECVWVGRNFGFNFAQNFPHLDLLSIFLFWERCLKLNWFWCVVWEGERVIVEFVEIRRWWHRRWCTRDGWCGADGGKSADPTSICGISCWSRVCLLTIRESLSIMWYCLKFFSLLFSRSKVESSIFGLGKGGIGIRIENCGCNRRESFLSF